MTSKPYHFFAVCLGVSLLKAGSSLGALVLGVCAGGNIMTQGSGSDPEKGLQLGVLAVLAPLPLEFSVVLLHLWHC